ncbi:Steroid Delta-isomerase [BD1-7 clade bacterium]|uniref:Steroid Delta-isomerase n=1 Tax=BD1-7 clade bacterium TaxID=2029982 RepID=A0A5S9NVN1_9GAMM|nr:Steroid Delta-isomerase [BD1-7 clade bacterium]CAA0110024.1 Steroid Delta-isomerase [BD1-7 clade bacterium]
MTDHLDHPAIKANIQSVTLASEGNKDAWLALYADDAILQDPVGKSPLEESGTGHVGKPAIEAFWDTVIGPSNIQIHVKKRIPSGDRHCAVLQTAINDMGNDKTTEVDMIATYEVDDNGLIKRMSAYWCFDDLMKQMF